MLEYSNPKGQKSKETYGTMVWDLFHGNRPEPTESTKSTKEEVTKPVLCDYDNDCIELFKYIGHKRWVEVVEFLDTGSWPGFSLFPDTFDPMTQASTIVCKFDHANGDPTKVLWSRLPLTYAVEMDAPLAVVRRLFDLFPNAVRWKNSSGQLALHTALLNGASDDIICFLISVYPESINQATSLGLNPIQLALQNETRKDRGKMLAVMVHYSKLQTDSNATNNGPMNPNIETLRAEQTELYNKIQIGDWGSIIEFIDSGVWSEKKGIFWDEPEKVTPKEQAKTFVTRYDPIDQKVTLSQLPLHAAIIKNAPHSVTRRLLALYPEGIRLADDRGMLPIHLALFYNASDNLIVKLLLDYPESVNVKSALSLTPLDCALRSKEDTRGKILDMFVKKTTAKNAKKSVTNALAKNDSLLDLEIVAKKAKKKPAEKAKTQKPQTVVGKSITAVLQDKPAATSKSQKPETRPTSTVVKKGTLVVPQTDKTAKANNTTQKAGTSSPVYKKSRMCAHQNKAK